MADSDDESGQVLVKVLPLALEETSKKTKGNGDQDQHVQGHVEIANRKRLVPRTRKMLQKSRDNNIIEQPETSTSIEDQAQEHQKDAEEGHEKREDKDAAKVDESDKNQKLEAQPDGHEKVKGNDNLTHKGEDHSDEKDNDHDTNNQDAKGARLGAEMSTVTKLQIWWEGGKAVAEHTEHATKDSHQEDEISDDEEQVDKNQVDKNQDDDTQHHKNEEQSFQTSQLPDEEPQQKEDLTPVALPDTPPSSPVAYHPTPAAFFPAYSVVHHSMPAAFFAPAQSSASDDSDDDDKFLSKVFQVGQQSKEDSEQRANDMAQDDRKEGDEIESEAKQDQVNRKDKIQEGENSSASQSSSLTAAPKTTTTTPPAPLALQVKRKHSPVPTPGIATMVTRADPIAFHFGGKPSPACTSHGTEGPVLGAPFADSSKHTPSFGPVPTGKTQSPYSKAGVSNQGKGGNPRTPASSEEQKEEEEQEPESDPDDRSPLTEEQMWEKMHKALRRIEKKKTT